MSEIKEIQNAINGLDGLKELISPLLLKTNYERQGKQDVKEFESHLNLAIQALKEKQEREWTPASERLPKEHEVERQIYDCMACEGDWGKIPNVIDTEIHTESDLVLVTVKTLKMMNYLYVMIALLMVNGQISAMMFLKY